LEFKIITRIISRSSLLCHGPNSKRLEKICDMEKSCLSMSLSLFGIWKYRHQPTIDTWCRSIKVFCLNTKWRSLAMEAAVDGGHGDGGLCRWWSLSTKVAVGWRGNDAMALGQWLLWPMVAVAMGPSSSTVQWRLMPPQPSRHWQQQRQQRCSLPLPPSTTASISNDCHCSN
jgi:hypothetical protein